MYIEEIRRALVFAKVRRDLRCHHNYYSIHGIGNGRHLKCHVGVYLQMVVDNKLYLQG